MTDTDFETITAEQNGDAITLKADGKTLIEVDLSTICMRTLILTSYCSYVTLQRLRELLSQAGSVPVEEVLINAKAMLELNLNNIGPSVIH